MFKSIFIALFLLSPFAAGAEKEILYSIVLDDTVERVKINGYTKRNVRFSYKNLKKVKKYDVFLVLTDDQKGVLSEIVVVKKKKKKKYAYAKIVRTSWKKVTKNYLKKTIIRLEDLRKVIGNADIFRENSNVQLSFHRSSAISTPVNILTGAAINAVTLSSGIVLELFAPKKVDQQWFNWLGLRFTQSQISETKVNIRAATTDITQEATIGGSSQSAEFIIQPWFQDFFIHHFALIFGLQAQQTETLALDGRGSAAPTNFKLNRQHSYLGLELGFNPIPRIYTGINFNYSPSKEFEVQEANKEQPYKGSWSSNTIKIYGELLTPIYNDIQFKVKVEISRRQDSIAEAPSLGTGQDHSIIDWSPTLLLGLAYTTH